MASALKAASRRNITCSALLKLERATLTDGAAFPSFVCCLFALHALSFARFN
jgi:hypothetical protein